jgi:hypothetical protein
VLNNVFTKENTYAHPVNLLEEPNAAKAAHLNPNTETYATSPTATTSSGDNDFHDEYVAPTDVEAAVTEVPHKINPNVAPSAPSASTRRRNASKSTSDSHGSSKDTKNDKQARKNQ